MVKKVGEDNKIYEGGHMSKDYKSMWSGMGLNLEAHDGLLAVLSDAYKGIYLSQKQRPAGMGYFDFVISEVHGLRIEEIVNAKESGKHVIGTFCVYVPEELVLAVDGVCIGLCAGADVGTDEAEKYIPKNTCALIKAFMGFKLAGLCPYVQLTNMIVGETTCDGKKKAYEIFNEITKKIYVMELPNMKSVDGKKLWKNEVKKFATKLEELTGKKITLDKLKDACRVVNEKRKALQRLSALRSAKPSPISGSPMAIPNWKLHAIIEGSGAVVVGEESCIGERNFKALLDESFTSPQEALEMIADRYMTIDCACFTPNDERMENIKELTKRLKADGVVHYALQFCTPYMMESYRAKKAVDALSLPFLRIETDYSMEDFGQLRTRIEAFLEVIRGN